MTRAQAAANARAVRSGRLKHSKMVQKEAAALRRQTSMVLTSGMASGVRVHLGDIDEEYVPDLKTLHGRTGIFERMANDPIVRAQLNAIVYTIISSVRWKVEGGSDEQQELVAANFLRQGPRKLWCARSWIDLLYEMLGCLTYGFALFGKVRTVVEGRQIFSDLRWLHPRSVDEDGWVMDDSDNLIQVRRSYTDATGRFYAREPIDARDLFLIPWDRRGPNWEGNAYIRPFYRPWKERDLAAKIELIDLQNRGVGIPKGKLGLSSGKKSQENMVQILGDLRGGSKERVFIVEAHDEEIKFLTSEGQAKDAGPILARARLDTAAAGGTMALEQSTTSSGSRASTSALMTPFYVIANAFKVYLESIMNDGAGPQAGIVQELQDMNFDEIEEYARLIGTSVSPTEQLDNVPLILDAVQKGGVTHEIGVENHNRNSLGVPLLTPEAFDEARKANTVQPLGGRPPEGNPRDLGDDPRNDTESRRFGLRAAAQKKTPDASPRTKNAVCWPWVT